MSRTGRAFGIARSLLVYHAIPLRQRRMQRLYRQFVRPGDLVFDIGAHVGNRARALAAIGCRVVALEPQPDFGRGWKCSRRRWPAPAARRGCR